MNWSRRALADLARLDAFLAERSPEAASRAVETIRERARLLDDHPFAGRPSLDIGPTYRELVINFGQAGYVLLYRVDAGAVTAIALRHQREAGYD